MTRLAMLVALLQLSVAGCLHAQRSEHARVGIGQPAVSALVAPPVAMHRAVRWKTGALVGFGVGAIAGVVLLRGADEAPAPIIIYFGLLGALVGALGQALFSGTE